MSGKNDLKHNGTELTPIEGFLTAAHPLLNSEEKLEERTGQLPFENKGIKRKRDKFITRAGGHRFEGWKFTIFGAFIASLVVLFFNVGFLLYCVTHPKHDAVDLYPIADQDTYRAKIKHQISTLLFEGNCDKVHHLSIGFHLLINVLSTTLLSASNFGMVCEDSGRENIGKTFWGLCIKELTTLCSNV